MRVKSIQRATDCNHSVVHCVNGSFLCMGVSFASFQDLGMLAFAMSSLKRAAMRGTSTSTFSQLLSLCLGTHLQAHLMKVGVIVSTPGEGEMLIPEIWVATKVCSSSSSGVVKGCGPRGCALLCLRPS